MTVIAAVTPAFPDGNPPAQHPAAFGVPPVKFLQVELITPLTTHPL